MLTPYNSVGPVGIDSVGGMFGSVFIHRRDFQQQISGDITALNDVLCEVMAPAPCRWRWSNSHPGVYVRPAGTQIRHHANFMELEVV